MSHAFFPKSIEPQASRRFTVKVSVIEVDADGEEVRTSDDRSPDLCSYNYDALLIILAYLHGEAVTQLDLLCQDGETEIRWSDVPELPI
jgi:hypothetical protein